MLKSFTSIILRALSGWGILGLIKMIYFEFFYILKNGLADYKKIGYRSSLHTNIDNHNIPTPYVYLYYLKKFLLNYKDFTFIDVGSGVGRVLRFALDLKFKKIISIEKSIILNKSLKKEFGNKIIYFEKDATQFSIEDEKKVIFYFFESFDGNVFYNFIKNQITKNSFENLLVVMIISEIENPINLLLNDFKIKEQLKFSNQRSMLVLEQK